MGRNWAIAIGINGYSNLQDLSYAERDALSMREYFEQEEGFERVYHFAKDAPDIPVDRGPSISSTPSYANLRRFLRVRFEQPFLSKGDNFWFFFAGHGMRYQERDYLMPFDGDPGDVSASGLSLHYVTERLRRCGADNVVLLIDACRSQGRRDGAGGIGHDIQKGVVTIYSCSPNESSYEIDAIQQGAFTHTLLSALRLQGEGNCATVERLNQYLCHNVPALNRRHQKPPQTPYISLEPATKLHLILLPKQATMQDIATLREDASDAELEGELGLAEQLWTRVLAVSPADSRALKGLRRIWTRSIQSREESSGDDPIEAGARQIEDPPSRSLLIPSPPSSEPPSSPTPPPSPSLTSTYGFEVVQVNKRGEIVDRQHSQAVYEGVDLGNGVTLEMVQIPGGTFLMGSPSDEPERSKAEGPQHQVSVPSFWMGRYPITQAQWRAIASLPQVNRELAPTPSYFKGDKHPVEQVSWEESVEACKRLSAHTGKLYRLPSEAEWEYACRAGRSTPFHFGETITSDLANYAGEISYAGGPTGESRNTTTAVETFPYANAFGLSDMHGNVFEWCQDSWHETYEDAPTDGSAWQEDPLHNNRRVIRGGSWGYDPRSCRSAYRVHDAPDYQLNDVGFRVVLVPR